MGLLDSFKKYSHGHWDHGNESPGLSSEQRQQMGAPQQADAQNDEAERQLQRRNSHEGATQEREARQVVQAAALDIPKQKTFQKTLSMPASYGGPFGSPLSPTSPDASGSPSSVSPRVRENVWHSVFHPGRNPSMKKEGATKFDNANSSAKGIYDWMYMEDGSTRSKHQ